MRWRLREDLGSGGRKLPGKEQLAVLKFAEALEHIPTILALTAGLDPVDAIAELRRRHDASEVDAGVDVLSGKVANMTKINVVDPLLVKVHVIRSAAEAAIMILRIDDIVAAAQTKTGGTGKSKTESGGEESESKSSE